VCVCVCVCVCGPFYKHRTPAVFHMWRMKSFIFDFNEQRSILMTLINTHTHTHTLSLSLSHTQMDNFQTLFLKCV